MTFKIYTDENIKLTGIMTERMIKDLKIPMEKTKMHGFAKLTAIRGVGNTVNLYEVPIPYNEIEVFYGNFWHINELIPNYYFTSTAVKEFKLTPIGDNEKEIIVCRWVWSGDREKIIPEYSFLYNRKNEEKYRLRFLMDPEFDPHEWESKQEKNKTTS